MVDLEGKVKVDLDQTVKYITDHVKGEYPKKEAFLMRR